MGLCTEVFGRGEPVQAGHAYVHQDEVRLQGGHARDRRIPVGGLAHHGEVGLAVDDHAQSHPDQLLVVADQHP